MKIHPTLFSLLLLAPLVTASLAAGQGPEPPDPDYERERVFPSFAAFEAALNDAASIADAMARDVRLDAFFEALEVAGQVPYAEGRDVAFLYRGPGSSVAFPGDHTGWSPGGAPAQRIADSDVWMYRTSFIADARVDYKIVRDGVWILDPRNPLQMWSGFGPNSELRMPEYRYPRETIPRPGIDKGQLSPNILIHSAYLGYDVHFRVYTPAGTGHMALPVVYFTDGHEYLAHHLGSAVVVLDNLIAAERLAPSMAVFIDPRDTVTGENRRFEQYAGNGAFADFVALELVPSLDTSWPTEASAPGRTILGTSLGGLFSAYLGGRHPDVFENIAIQSPAFQVFPSIYGTYAGNTTLAAALDIYMEAGTIHDGSGGANFAPILAAGGYDHVFEEVHQGHSWGHWRGKLDDALLSLVGGP